MISENDFTKITDEVIDKLEGGYYHPKMLVDGRVKDSRYGASGETLYGLDRKAGAGLSRYPEWQRFWNRVDTLGASDKWSWNYKGGANAPELKKIAGQVMFKEYNRLYNKYLTPESQKIVDSDPRLVFNFAYATWNGEGWFKRFADVFNDAVAKGERNKEKLVDLVVARRTQSTNSLIAQGGRKISQFIDSLKSVAIQTGKNRGALVVIGIVAIGLSIYLYRRFNKK